MPRQLFAKSAALMVSGLLVLGGCGGQGPNVAFDDAASATPDYSYVIPAGTGERIDDGEDVEIVPARLDVRVGEVIHISNEDDRGHSVGPFFVGAHENLSQRFASAGELVGACSVHPSGQLVVSVTE